MESRIDRARAGLPEEADGILLSNPTNIRYLTGVNLTDGYLLLTRQRACLFADSRYIEAAEKAKSEAMEVKLYKTEKSISEALAGIRCLCFEDQFVTCFDLHAMQKAWPGVHFMGCGGLLSHLRECKDETELDYIMTAQRIAEKAFDAILGFISTDRTEAEVALELEYQMRRNGASGVAFDTIAVSGARSSLPHGEPSDKKIEKGFLTMDFGAVYNGYCSDMTRTVVVGKADEAMVKLYETVKKAQEAALAAIGPGEACAGIDRLARDIIEAAYPGCFGHGLGHGVGLYIHEAPSLSPKSSQTLKAGHVVTVEPGVYLPGQYGVRIEDMVYITEQGALNLTRAPKDLIEL